MPDIHPVGDHESLPQAIGVTARQVLVVAHQTATSSALISELHERARRGRVVFHLVVPALNSRLRHWLSDVDDALSAARRRGAEAVTVLESHGLAVTAEVGDSVPLLAVEDALSQFAADEIVISTLPPDRSHWLEQDLVDRVRGRFGVPVSHVITDECASPLPLRHARLRSRVRPESEATAMAARVRPVNANSHR